MVVRLCHLGMVEQEVSAPLQGTSEVPSFRKKWWPRDSHRPNHIQTMTENVLLGELKIDRWRNNVLVEVTGRRSRASSPPCPYENPERVLHNRSSHSRLTEVMVT